MAEMILLLLYFLGNLFLLSVDIEVSKGQTHCVAWKATNKLILQQANFFFFYYKHIYKATNLSYPIIILPSL